MLIGWTVVAWPRCTGKGEQRGQGKRAGRRAEVSDSSGRQSSVSRKKTCPARRAGHTKARQKIRALVADRTPRVGGGARQGKPARLCYLPGIARGLRRRIPPRHACGHRRSGSGPEDIAPPAVAARCPAPEAWLVRNVDRLRNAAIGASGRGGTREDDTPGRARRRLLAQGCDVGWLLLDARDSGARLVEGMVACVAATGDARFGVAGSHAAKVPGGEIDALTATVALHPRRSRFSWTARRTCRRRPPPSCCPTCCTTSRDLHVAIASRRALPVPLLSRGARRPRDADRG